MYCTNCGTEKYENCSGNQSGLRRIDVSAKSWLLVWLGTGAFFPWNLFLRNRNLTAAEKQAESNCDYSDCLWRILRCAVAGTDLRLGVHRIPGRHRAAGCRYFEIAEEIGESGWHCGNHLWRFDCCHGIRMYRLGLGGYRNLFGSCFSDWRNYSGSGCEAQMIVWGAESIKRLFLMLICGKLLLQVMRK